MWYVTHALARSCAAARTDAECGGFPEVRPPDILMSPLTTLERCDICGQSFRYGPIALVQGGTFLPVYQLMVCSSCYTANEHGWTPQLEEVVIRNLKSQRPQIPMRNTNGLLPRDGY